MIWVGNITPKPNSSIGLDFRLDRIVENLLDPLNPNVTSLILEPIYEMWG